MSIFTSITLFQILGYRTNLVGFYADEVRK